MSNEDRWSILWSSWALAFVVAETVAIASDDPTAPLSHHLRKTLGVHKSTVHHRLGQVAFATGTLWLARHTWKKVAP